jgi:hypothetical protein
MRHPLSLWRDCGAAGFTAFQLVIGGTVLAGLVYPLFVFGALYELVQRASGPADAFTLYAYLHRTIFILGIGCSAFLGAKGLARRGLLSQAWILLLIPVHWLALSLASWRALYQFFFDRYRWEKTEHGRGHRLMRTNSSPVS